MAHTSLGAHSQKRADRKSSDKPFQNPPIQQPTAHVARVRCDQCFAQHFSFKNCVLSDPVDYRSPCKYCLRTKKTCTYDRPQIQPKAESKAASMEAEQAPDAAKLETTMVAKPKAAAKPKDASKSKKSGAPNTKSTLNKVQRGRVEKPAPRTRAAPKSYAELSANDDKEEDDRLSQMDGDNDEDIDEDINEDTNDELSQMDGENDKDIDEVTNDQLYDEEGEQSADEDEAENEYTGPRLTGIVNGFDLSELSPLAYRVLEGRGYIRNGQWMGGV